jgi:hypothetical protein
MQMLLSLAKAQRTQSFCLNEGHSGKSHPAAREEKRFLYLAAIPACLKQEATPICHSCVVLAGIHRVAAGLSLSFPQGSGGNP